jgi:hypothetical protein
MAFERTPFTALAADTALDRAQANLLASLQLAASVGMDAPVIDCGENHGTAGQVLLQAFDYGGGPTFNDLFALVVRAARGDDVKEDAEALIQRAMLMWARQTARVESDLGGF